MFVFYQGQVQIFMFVYKIKCSHNLVYQLAQRFSDKF